MGAADEIQLVTATVLRVERIDSGRLLALASVEIEIAGVAFVLHGVRVIKTGPRQRGIAAPAHRVANGRLADTITMPPELARAIANAVLDEYDELRRPSPAPVENRPAAASQGWPKRHPPLP